MLLYFSLLCIDIFCPLTDCQYTYNTLQVAGSAATQTREELLQTVGILCCNIASYSRQRITSSIWAHSFQSRREWVV